MTAARTRTGEVLLPGGPVELVKLRASLINGWNRLAIAFRTVPGTFQVGERPPDRPAVPSSEIKAAR